MNGLNKHLAVAFVSIAILFVGMAHTATFPQFDVMSDDAKTEFVTDMVDRTEQALRDEGKADLAGKNGAAFVDIAPRDRLSLGMVELERNIARARVADLHGLEKDPKAKRVYVEDALLVTLEKNGIELSDKGNHAADQPEQHVCQAEGERSQQEMQELL
jgi:hypothetical protein